MKDNKRTKDLVMAGIALLVIFVIFFMGYNFFVKKSNGANKTITMEVYDSTETMVSYEIKTGADSLRQAMDELAASGSGFTYSGEDTEYGIMITEINGETADFTKDNAYWALYANGELSEYGADSLIISDGEVYSWKYEKQ